MFTFNRIFILFVICMYMRAGRYREMVASNERFTPFVVED